MVIHLHERIHGGRDCHLVWRVAALQLSGELAVELLPAEHEAVRRNFDCVDGSVQFLHGEQLSLGRPLLQIHTTPGLRFQRQ